MMPGLGIVILGAFILIVLVLLVQVYFSSRPSFIWGLLMPFIFLLIGLYVIFDLHLLPIDITPNDTGRALFICIGLVGMLITAIVLVLSRMGLKYREKRKAQNREQRVLARQQKLAAEAAMLGQNANAVQQAALAEFERMERARELALAESERKARDIEETRNTRRALREEKKQRRKETATVNLADVTPELTPTCIDSTESAEPIDAMEDILAEKEGMLSQAALDASDSPLLDDDAAKAPEVTPEMNMAVADVSSQSGTVQRIDLINTALKARRRAGAASINFYRYLSLTTRQLVRKIGVGGKRLIGVIKISSQTAWTAGTSGLGAATKAVLKRMDSLKTTLKDKTMALNKQKPEDENNNEEEHEEEHEKEHEKEK